MASASRSGAGSALAPYRAVLASRVRAQVSHRASFRIDLAGSFLVGVVELAEISVLFHSVTRLGGLHLGDILVVFGISEVCFSLADLAVGHLDTLPTYLRAGTLDVFYLRPQPLLLQLVTSEVSLRRLARAGLGLVVLVVALVAGQVDWSPAKVVLLAVTLVASTATFAGVFVLAAGVQFFLVDGAEATNSFVYGGRYASTQPASVWGRPLTAVFGFAIPMAFTAYLPTLELLGLPGPAGLPAWLGWCTPLAALWTWALALTAWRLGVRHYRGGGG